MDKDTHKKCKNCLKNKEIKYFGICSSSEDGLLLSCKKCTGEYQKKNYRSEVSLIGRIYNNQTGSSKRRGHNPPSYTKQELIDWVLSRPNFEYLYKKWVESNYNKWLKPSVDRLKNDKGYYFGNIQLITWDENQSNPRKEKSNLSEKISITIGIQNHKAIKEYASKIDRSKSKTIDLAIAEYLEKNVPNYKYKQILKDSKNESSKQ